MFKHYLNALSNYNFDGNRDKSSWQGGGQQFRVDMPPMEMVREVFKRERSQTLASLLLNTSLNTDQICDSLAQLKDEGFILVIGGGSSESEIYKIR